MRQVVLAFVLLALVCGTWLWLRSDGEDVLHAPPATNGRADAAVTPAREAVAAPVAESTAVRAEAPAATSDGAPFPADAQWIDVRIVDAVTKQPAAGADVHWIDEAASSKVQAMSHRERAPFVGNIHRMALELGRQLDVPLPTTAVANEFLTAARGMGLAEDDFATVFNVLKSMAGVK